MEQIQNLELLIEKDSITAYGSKKMVLTGNLCNCNPVIIRVENCTLENRPSVPGSTIFRFEKQNQYDTKTVLVRASWGSIPMSYSSINLTAEKS
jgi:hypothetical protein